MELKTISGKKARVTKITDVVLDSPVPVYNLETALYSNFILLGGVVVHNSDTIISYYREFEVRPEQKAKDMKCLLRRGETTYDDVFNRIIRERPGSIIDTPLHIKEGRLFVYDQPADGLYIWIIDNKGNFRMSPARGALPMEGIGKIPHSLLAKGEPVFGSGEVIFEEGRVKSINSFSGHYYPGEELKVEFDCQANNVFRDFMNRVGLNEVSEGASFSLTPFH